MAPISSLPYVLTFMTLFSFGTTTFIINLLFVVVQILILKKEFKKKDMLQIFVALCFGLFIDLGMYVSEPLKTHNYWGQIIMLLAGCTILALGVALEVAADILYVPGEGLVKAIAYKTHQNFGKIKIGFDISHCVIAIFLSLAVLYSVHGLREGTVISAFLVGTFVSLYHHLFVKLRQFHQQHTRV